MQRSRLLLVWLSSEEEIIDLLNFIKKEHKFTKSEMVMIGDNYHTDILCGINFGCDTIHVNTGVNSTEYVQNQVKKKTKSVEYLSI